MTSAMPTEMEAVAFNLHEVAKALATEIAALPDQVAATMDWSLNTEQHALVVTLARELGLRARLLEFSLESLASVLASQAEDDRTMFANAAFAVDNCRLARSIHAAYPTPNSDVPGRALDVAEEALASVQDVLRRRFPGEETPGV